MFSGASSHSGSSKQIHSHVSPQWVGFGFPWDSSEPASGTSTFRQEVLLGFLGRKLDEESMESRLGQNSKAELMFNPDEADPA